MKASHFPPLMSICFLLSSCATHDPTAARNAGEKHFLAHGGREWQAEVDKLGAQPKGLIWRAEGQPRAVLICLHGIQTHSAWFGPLAEELNQQGWTVIAPDRRGSGLNSDQPFVRGHTSGTKELLDDLEAQILAARREAIDRPVYFLGTSWGSNLAGAYVCGPDRPKPDGLIQLVPATGVRKPHTPGLFGKLYYGAANLVAPKTKTSLKFGPRHYLAGHDQSVIRKEGKIPPVPKNGESGPPELLESDTLVQGILRRDESPAEGALLTQPSVRTLLTGNRLNQQWHKQAKKLEQAKFPVLVITAGHDQIMDNKAASSVFEHPGQGSIALISIRAGHAVQISQAAEVAQVITRWASDRQRK
jgi:alpha-beta hydrolase superfamily lysophospholipase